jgi:hypothetical protein
VQVVDGQVEGDGADAAGSPQHHVVESEPDRQVRSARVYLQARILLDAEVAHGEPLQRRRQLIRGHLDEETQIAMVNPEHRNGPVDHQPHPAEHRAVTAQRDEAVQFGRELGVRYDTDLGRYPVPVDFAGQQPDRHAADGRDDRLDRPVHRLHRMKHETDRTRRRFGRHGLTLRPAQRTPARLGCRQQGTP